MVWLAVHMWFLLIAAFAIGLGAGWWIWGARARDGAEQAPVDDTVTLGSLDADSASELHRENEKETAA